MLAKHIPALTQFLMPNKIIPYRKDLRSKARVLRKHSTLAEVLLWNELRQNQLGYQFHRQVPMLDFIVDFYCHELMLAIEVDGNTHEYKVNYDVWREKKIAAYGVKFLRYRDEDVKGNIKWVVNHILEWIEESKE
jgi:very-short-patch-repair endonuclease